MIEAILFDADGVIINRSIYFAQKLEQEYNVPPEIIQEFFSSAWLDIVIGKTDLKEQILPYLDRWNWDGTVDELLKYWFDAENQLDDRLLNAIQILKNHNIACHLATNQEKYRLAYIKNEMGLIHHLDKFYCSCDLGVKKPQTEYFSHIIADLQFSPDQLMFWDDTPKNVAAAQQLGIHAVHYQTYSDFSVQISQQLHITLPT